MFSVFGWKCGRVFDSIYFISFYFFVAYRSVIGQWRNCHSGERLDFFMPFCDVFYGNCEHCLDLIFFVVFDLCLDNVGVAVWEKIVSSKFSSLFFDV